MTRMTNDVANTIAKRVIDYKYQDALIAADKDRKDAGEAFRELLYKPFAKAMKSLPEGAFVKSNSVKVNTLLGQRTLTFHTDLSMLYSHTICYKGRIIIPVTKIEAEQGDNPIYKAAHVAIASEEYYQELRSDRNNKFNKLCITIRAYTSVEKLTAALPSVEPFVFGITDRVLSLPVVQVAEFNATFGLPADPKLIKGRLES